MGLGWPLLKGCAEGKWGLPQDVTTGPDPHAGAGTGHPQVRLLPAHFGYGLIGTLLESAKAFPVACDRLRHAGRMQPWLGAA